MWLLVLASALAVGPVLEVFTNAQVVRAPLVATLAGEQVALSNDGVSPDRAANDGYWSGAAPGLASAGLPQRLEIVDGAGTIWEGTVEWSGEGDARRARVGLERGGTLIKPPFPAPAAVPGQRAAMSEPGGVAPPASSSSGGERSAQPAWLLAALGWGLFLAVALRQVRLRPIAVPGRPGPLAARRYRIKADADAQARLLGWLAERYRVVLLGQVQASVPAGAVFVPRSPDLGDVSALIEALDGLGRPLAVLIAPGVKDAAALAEGLSSDVPVLVTSEDFRGDWRVGEDGAPARRGEGAEGHAAPPPLSQTQGGR